MEKNKKILAIIPARGGSKGIPRKNIRLLSGKPLIVYTIEAALKSKYLDRIVVSTDDDKIGQISKSAGAEFIKRPQNLAEDNSPTYPLIEHVADYLEKNEKNKPDIIVLLQPTSPLRTTKDIDQSIELFLSNNCGSVISVVDVGSSVYISLKMGKKYLQPLFSQKFLDIGLRQVFPEAYVTNGAIFISSLKNLYLYKSFYGKKILPYVMPQEKSVNIDHEIDFKLVELLMQQK